MTPDPDPVWHMGPLPEPPALSAVESELDAWDNYWDSARWEKTVDSQHIPTLSDAAFDRLCGYPPGGMKRLSEAGAEADQDVSPWAAPEPEAEL